MPPHPGAPQNNHRSGASSHHRIAIEGLSVESDADLLRGAHDQGIREATETMVQHVRTTLLLIPCATERYRIRLEKAYKAINR